MQKLDDRGSFRDVLALVEFEISPSEGQERLLNRLCRSLDRNRTGRGNVAPNSTNHGNSAVILRRGQESLYSELQL
jgi:hypothetical protein